MIDFATWSQGKRSVFHLGDALNLKEHGTIRFGNDDQFQTTNRSLVGAHIDEFPVEVELNSSFEYRWHSALSPAWGPHGAASLGSALIIQVAICNFSANIIV